MQRFAAGAAIADRRTVVPPLLGYSFAIGVPLDELSESARRAQLARLAAHGFELVEWTTRDASNVSGPALRRDLDLAGVRLGALGTGAAALRDGLSLSAADAGVRAAAQRRVRATVALAGELGAPAIVGLLRGPAGGDPSARGRLVEALHALGEDAQRQGTRIVIEPINRYEVDTLPTVADVRALVTEAAHPALAVMADLFHMNIEERDVRDALVEHAAELAYVHVADSNRCAPGCGHLPLADLLAALLAAGYGGPLVCELLPGADAGEDVRVAAARLAAALA